jgi:hypothetical protein
LISIKETEKDNFSFVVGAKTKIRYAAGPYDKVGRSPHYEISWSIWKNETDNVEAEQFLMGKEGNYTWVWDIKNNSTWPAFITVKCDGVIIQRSKVD